MRMIYLDMKNSPHFSECLVSQSQFPAQLTGMQWFHENVRVGAVRRHYGIRMRCDDVTLSVGSPSLCQDKRAPCTQSAQWAWRPDTPSREPSSPGHVTFHREQDSSRSSCPGAEHREGDSAGGTGVLQDRPWSSSRRLCSVAQWCLTLRPHGLQPTRLLCAWGSPGKNNGVAISSSRGLTQGSYPCLLTLLHWQVDSLPLSHLGSVPCAQDNTEHRKHPSREDPGSWRSPPSSQYRLAFRSPTFLPLVNRCIFLVWNVLRC